ncbi:MAG: hypothetical protein J1E63_06395, partial [Muribaculaceae bacterium]|nr:hypothetical protein [Muribaculaceae bacterium]
KGSGTGFAAVKIERPEPVTEPVITAEGATIKSYVAGEAVTVAVPVTGANLVASTLTATLTPEVAGLSVALDNAAIVDGAIATTATLTYNATDNAKGQTTLVLAAGDFTKEVTVDYKALVNHAVLVPVAADANWDFSTGVSGGVDFGEPEKNIEFVYSEIEELTFTDEFKAESLAFQGTYPRRVGKDFAQDGVLHFVAAVPGTVEVKFSDTGSSASSSATPRYLVVNGEQTEFWASRPNNSSDGAYDEKKNVVGTVEVPAGDVYISGSQALVYHYVKFTAGEETPQPGVVAAPTFDPASGATVTPMQYIKISAEEGATIYWMDLAYEEYGFEEYTEDACMIPWSAKVGSTVTFQAYAEKDGVKSDVAEAVYTVGKTDPELAWYVNGETVTEFTYDMAKNTVDDLPKVESMSDGALTLTSSNEAVATINSDLGVEILAAGTTVITATLAETSMFAGATASFTLTVVGNEVEEETLTAILYNPTKVTQTSFKDSELGVGEGWTLECLGSKTIGQGIDVVVDGKTYRALKKSASDSQLRLTLPAEYVATGVTFYTYVNGTDLGTSYWSEVAGTEYTQEESPLFQATKENVDNLDVNSFTINPANSFTFDHKGKEVGLVMKVNYKIASGVESVTIFDTDDNAPVYNIYGQRVDDTYRGYVIKNGKKYLQK